MTNARNKLTTTFPTFWNVGATVKMKSFIKFAPRRLAELKTAVAPMKRDRLNLQRDINRLMFESVIAPADDETARTTLETEEQILAELAERIAPVQKEIDQLGNLFWVTKTEVQAHKYDLSASRYRQIETDETFYEEPNITLERLQTIENVMQAEVRELQTTLV